MVLQTCVLLFKHNVGINTHVNPLCLKWNLHTFTLLHWDFPLPSLYPKLQHQKHVLLSIHNVRIKYWCPLAFHKHQPLFHRPRSYLLWKLEPPPQLAALQDSTHDGSQTKTWGLRPVPFLKLFNSVFASPCPTICQEYGLHPEPQHSKTCSSVQTQRQKYYFCLLPSLKFISPLLRPKSTKNVKSASTLNCSLTNMFFCPNTTSETSLLPPPFPSI